MKYKAAIFDLDGTLIDSTWVWKTVGEKFYEMLDVVKKAEYTESVMHMPPTECAAYVKKLYNLTETVDEIKMIWYKIAKNLYLNEVKLKPGVKKLLEIMISNGIRISIATSGYPEITELILKKYEIYDKFDQFFYSDILGVNKGSADIYMIAAKNMKIEPKYCVVFEDILKPLEFVKKCGMKYFGVDDRQSDETKQILRQKADFYIDNFDNFIDSGDFERLFELKGANI